MSKNYGYIQPVIKPEDYKFGASPLPQKVLAENGQWLKWVPDFEPQSKGFDTFSCVAFGNLNIIEMLGKRISELDENFSERFVAINGNIRPPGSSPTEIAEVIRKQGIIYEKLLPWSDDLATLDEWRSFKGADEEVCKKKGLDWVSTFNYGYEVVPTDEASLKSALRFSPLGVAVTAWHEDSKQQFYSPPGVPSNHWCVLIGYTDDYWLIFDSYSNDGVPFKHLRKDYNFGFAMRFNLELKPETKKKLNLLERLLLTLKEWLNLLPATPVKPVESIIMKDKKNSLIDKFCLAIQEVEGFYPGSRAYRNNNPGNLRWIKQNLAIGKDKDGFAIFKTYEDGYKTLKRMVTNACSGQSKVYRPTDTIQKFFEKYAPVSDSNNPFIYATKVAKQIGLTTQTQIKDLLG